MVQDAELSQTSNPARGEGEKAEVEKREGRREKREDGRREKEKTEGEGRGKHEDGGKV